MDCVRSITFIIPGVGGAPDVQVLAVEVDGTIEFTIDVLTTADGVTADLRGLFFDVANPSLLSALDATGSEVTDFDTDDVIDLGQGANMHGAADPFDVGVEFGQAGIGKNKGDIQTASFTLSNLAGDLTLDDIAQVEFGARLTSVGQMGGDRVGSAKLTTVAPAAPDAVDDDYTIFEDGQDGLDDPSDVSEGVVFNVLDNDTDADGDTLTITEVHDVMNGTVEIIDGDDADLLPGDAILFTPTTDFSGMGEFTYCITDNNGGTDFATVQVMIEAVADIPDVSIEAFATNKVNEVRLVVTATQTDDDNSEFIADLLSSDLPPGVTLVANGPPLGGQPTEYTQEYILTLPLDADTDFDLTFTATSEEVSNGDQETGSETIAIEYDYNSETTSVSFDADDRSIWGDDPAFQFIDDRFIGVDTGPFDESTSFGPFTAGINGNLKAGFQSTLEFNGGSIDAMADYDVTVETNYNRTVDELLIETGGVLTDAGFMTDGPSGSYTLDFIWDLFLQASAGIEIDLLVGTIDESVSTPPISVGPGSLNIIDLTSDDLGGSITLPPPAQSFSVDFAWPNVDTIGTPPPLDPVTSSGASNNFLQANLDIDELIATLAFGGVNPFNPRLDAGPFYAELDILNVVAEFGLNLLQQFEMDMGDLVGAVFFEDGSTQAFNIGDDLQISNALDIDAGGDMDGDVEFEFVVMPESELSNLTELGFNLGGTLEILSGEVGYDFLGVSDSVGFGPLFEAGFTQPIADIDVFNDTFDLAFDQETITAFA